MRKYLLFILFISLILPQVQQGGYPKYFDTLPNRDIQFITTDSRDIVDREFHPMVFQFGTEYEFGISFFDAAMIFIEDDIYTFLLEIRSNNAYGLAINFGNYFLTENAELYFYDKERTNFLGSLTSLNNKDSNNLTTSIIKGSEIVIELSKMIINYYFI